MDGIPAYTCSTVDDTSKSNGTSASTAPNGTEAEAEDSDDEKDEDGAADTGAPGGRWSLIEFFNLNFA
jgi:hypothetical protein